MPGELATSGIVLGVLSLVPLMTLACFGLVVAKLLRQGEVFAAAISLICLFLCGLGLLVALAYGWSKAGEWRCSAPRNSDQCIMGVEAPGEAHWDEETAAVHTRVQVQGRP